MQAADRVLAEVGDARSRARSPVRSLVLQERLARALPLGITLLTIGAIAIREVADPDIWWHLATGRYISAERRIPAFDVFSFTATSHRWVTHEWLSDFLLYGGYRLVGLAGLMFFFALVICAAFALVYWRCHSRPFVAACSVLMAAVACNMTWGVRPQMFSLLFASVYLYILEGADPGSSRRVWLLPPLTLLWANLHSSFVAGLVIIAVFALGQQAEWLARRTSTGPFLAPSTRRLALVGLGSLVCSLVTPNGIQAAIFPFGTLSNHLIQANIEEWFSPDFHKPLAWPLAVYWLALLAVMAVSRRRVSVTQLILLVGTAAASLYSMRHVPFFSLVGAPILAQQTEGLRSEPSAARRARPWPPVLRAVLAGSLAVLVVAVGARVYVVHQRMPAVEQALYPAAALAYMQEHDLSGRVFNTYHWGGYLIWHGYQVFIDGRAELYGDEVLRQYLQAYGVQAEWERPLLDNGIDVVLIESSSRLAMLLKESGRWEAAYQDALASVFVPVRPTAVRAATGAS